MSSSSSGSDIATPTLTLSGSGTPSVGPRASTAAADALGDLDRFARALLLTAQHDELVATDPRDEVASAHDRRKRTGDGDERAVTSRVSELIVDALEPVEVAEEQRGLTRTPIATSERETHG